MSDRKTCTCTCGSGGHPRHCSAHPLAYRAHCCLLNAYARAGLRVLDEMAAAVAKLGSAPRLIAITVDPAWPRCPMCEVAADGGLPGGIEVRRSVYLQPGRMLEHYSDGSIVIVVDEAPRE